MSICAEGSRPSTKRQQLLIVLVGSSESYKRRAECQLSRIREIIFAPRERHQIGNINGIAMRGWKYSLISSAGESCESRKCSRDSNSRPHGSWFGLVRKEISDHKKSRPSLAKVSHHMALQRSSERNSVAPLDPAWPKPTQPIHVISRLAARSCRYSSRLASVPGLFKSNA